jgi:hypothetical protein
LIVIKIKKVITKTIKKTTIGLIYSFFILHLFIVKFIIIL